MPPKKKKKTLSVFVLDFKTKENDKIVLQRVDFEISRERQAAVEASNVINDPKCNKGPKCNNFWP